MAKDCPCQNRRGIVAFLLIASAFWIGCDTRADVVLVENGEAIAQIVIPDDAPEIARFAAEELQAHLVAASGAKLLIVAESASDGEGPKVYVGPSRAAREAGIDVTALPPNGFVLRTIDDRLYLVGHDKTVKSRGSRGEAVGPTLDYNRSRVGSLFAVYEFLETRLGVRWLWPGEIGTYVPRTDSVVVSNLDYTDQPRYLFKHWRVPKMMREEAGWSSAEARDAFLIAQNTWLRRHRYAQEYESTTVATHAFGDYWGKYGEAQPEMFARLPNGKREPLAGDITGKRISMCVSEPTLWDRVIQDWLNYRDPSGPWVRAGENDSPGICTCERCRAWDAPDPRFTGSDYWAQGVIPGVNQRFRLDWAATPSLSDRYARFYAALLEATKKVDPDAKVTGYAYANYWEAPKSARLHEDVLISVVPSTPDGPSSSTYFPYTERKSRQFREQWDGWRATGASLILRPNMTLSGHNFPIYYAHRMGEDVAYAAKNGMVGSDFDSLRGSWGAQAPTLYTLARLQEDPGLGVDAVLAEFYAAFGEAEGAVRDYFNHWREVSDGVTDAQMNALIQARGIRAYSRWFLAAPDIFTPTVMAEGRRRLDRARAMAESDPLVRDRLEFLHRGLRDAELLLALVDAYTRHQRQASDASLTRYVQAMADLEDHRRDSEGWHIGNAGMLSREERQVFDSSLRQVHGDRLGLLPMTWEFKWDPEEVGVDRGWHAESGDEGAWERVALGNWQAQPIGEAWRAAHGSDYHGIAWYRTTFEAPREREPETSWVLQFGAVDEAATVWVNGQRVLERTYDAAVNPDSWKEPFDVDVDDAVHPGRTNCIVVRVESRRGAGGVTKPVRLRSIQH